MGLAVCGIVATCYLSFQSTRKLPIKVEGEPKSTVRINCFICTFDQAELICCICFQFMDVNRQVLDLEVLVVSGIKTFMKEV
jgi:hypothetical protein